MPACSSGRVYGRWPARVAARDGRSGVVSVESGRGGRGAAGSDDVDPFARAEREGGAGGLQAGADLPRGPAHASDAASAASPAAGFVARGRGRLLGLGLRLGRRLGLGRGSGSGSGLRSGSLRARPLRLGLGLRLRPRRSARFRLRLGARLPRLRLEIRLGLCSRPPARRSAAGSGSAASATRAGAIVETIDAHPAPVDDQVEHRRPSRRERRPERGLERLVRVDPDTGRPVALGHHRPVDVPEIGGDRIQAPPRLVVGDGPVACVVEDEDDRAGALPDGGLELSAGHAQAAIADERDDRPSRRGERRRDRGREAEAHRARRSARGTCPAGAPRGRAQPSRRSGRRRW